jgi:hypothetical protein
MKQFIKEHPWRLESVPFVIVLIALFLPLVHRHELMVNAGPLRQLWHGFTPAQSWWLHWALRVCMVIGIWLLGIQSNALWVRLELSKRVNYWAPPCAAIMAVAGWFCCWWHFCSLWTVAIVVAPILQILIDLTRRPTPKRDAAGSTVMASISRSEPFYYREDCGLTCRSLLGTIGNVGIMLGLVSVTGQWMPLAVIVPAAIIMNFSRLTFTITHDRITARVGGIQRIDIPMKDIISHGVHEHRPLEGRHHGWGNKIDGMITVTPRTGPCVRIETRDGKAYLLGMNHPEEVCRAISKIIVAD